MLQIFRTLFIENTSGRLLLIIRRIANENNYALVLLVSVRIQSECGKYGPEKTPYLDTFHAVHAYVMLLTAFFDWQITYNFVLAMN